MDPIFSERISSLAPSAIREILKVTQDPSVISFAAGNPSPDCFPSKEMAAISSELLSERPAVALQYGVTEGYTPLREQIRARMKQKYSIGGPDDDVIVVSGGQQGIEMTAKVFLNEGDTLLCEEPSFIGALNAFRSFGAVLKSVPVDADGVNPDAVEQILKNDRRVKLLYLIPTFQNPSGRVMSLEKRRALLALAEKYDTYIIEDNPYYDLRYEGTPVPTMKSMDDAGRVIYCGSFSKIFSPGMRIGFVVAPKKIISKIVVCKQVTDVLTNQFAQMILSEYLDKYDLDAHIADICACHSKKLNAMYSALTRECGGVMHIEKPEGGMFIWATLPENMDGTALCAAAAKHKVAAVPGAAFCAEDKPGFPAVRFNFTLPSIEEIERGAKLFGEAVAEL